MGDFKGTPGPWDYGWKIQPNGCPTVGHKGLMVCMVAHSAKDPEQKEAALANADLISAAPELLVLLQEARITLEMWKDAAPAVSLCADIDKAIAKALGK